MSVTVTKTAGNAAEITWEPKADDPHGYLARSVEGDQLAFALEVLGNQDVNRDGDADRALAAAMHTAELARLLERRAAVQVVQLRDEHGLSWRKISSAIFDDPFKQSSVRRMYDSGRRHLGTVTRDFDFTADVEADQRTKQELAARGITIESESTND